MRASHILERDKKQAGFTLIEVIISLLVLGFAIGGLMQLYMNLSVENVAAQYRGTSVMLAQELLEEIKAKRFDENTTKNLSGNWSVIGVDSGETQSTRSTLDDVDDYSGLSESLASPYSGYTRTASVIYVTSGNLDPGSGQTRDNDYKRITVSVSNGGTTYASLVSLVTRAREQV